MFKSFPVKGQDPAYQFVVVGAGVSGILLAERLSAIGKVLIVEMGNREKPCEAGTGFYEIESTGYPIQRVNSRLTAFGGSSNHWEGNSRPFSPSVFPNRPGIPGWPITYAEFAQYLPTAEKFLRLNPHQRDDAESRLPHPLLQGHGDLRVMHFQHSDPPRKLGDVATTDQFARSEHIDVVLDTAVVDINLGESGRRVESVRLLHRPSGETQTLEVKTLILCTGGVENPRLMLFAGRKYPSGNPLLGGPNELTGKWFSEHPRFRPVELFMDDRIDLAGAALARAPGWAERWYLSVSDACLQEHRLPRFAVNFTDTGRWAEGSELADANGHYFRQSDGLRRTLPSFVFEQAPIAESQVTLSNRQDPHGFPMARVNWQIATDDIHRMKQAVLLFCGLISQHGIARCRLIPEADTEDWTALEMLPGCHHMGATRMATGQLAGVVDPNSRVFGLQNLYVTGSSVFPNCDWVNPTLNLAALAARLADHLIRKNAGQAVTRQLTTGSPGIDVLGDGWSTPEAEGTWSDGSRAELSIATAGARQLLLRGYPYADTQIVMLVNGREIYSGHCGGLFNTTFDLDPQPSVNIVFRLSNLTTPESTGENDDTRALGVFLTEVQVR